MKKIIFLIVLLLNGNLIYSQYQKIYDKVIVVNSSQKLAEKEKKDIGILLDAIKFCKDFETEEGSMSGKINFGFDGNQSKLSELFKINAGVEIKKGIYPLELKLNAKINSTIKNGKVDESISDLYTALDYHPQVGGDGLWLENFVFVNRFNNSYLGIDQQYETGGGVIFNWYTRNWLHKEGKTKSDKFKTFPEYKKNDSAGIQSYNKFCDTILDNSNERLLKFTDEEIEYLNETKSNYGKENIKKQAKMRLALVLGIYFENAKVKAERNMKFNGVDSLFSIAFDATNDIRWELRPTMVFNPNNVFSFKIYPYFKFPIDKWFDEVKFNDITYDRRPDVFFDWLFTIDMKISNKISFGFMTRYFKDFAPKRKYILDNSNMPILIIGQQTNNYYSITMGYSF